jgi:hypothetical protein
MLQIQSLLQAICFKVADINAKNMCILIKVYSCLDCANKLSAVKLSTNRKSLIFSIGILKGGSIRHVVFTGKGWHNLYSCQAATKVGAAVLMITAYFEEKLSSRR